jgi:TatD DNase family protein
MQQAVEVAYSQYEYLALADAHCHLNLFENPEAAIGDSLKNNVRVMITSGGSAMDNAAAEALSDGINIFCVIGIDPEHMEEDARYVDGISGTVRGNKSIIGIGEIGLDFKNEEYAANAKIQKSLFQRQIDIAKELGIPIVVHARRAIKEAAEIVIGSEIERAMFHFFEGDAETARMLEKKEHVISIPPLESGRRKKVIEAIGIESIVAETDSPAVGKSPSDVRKAIDYIARVKGIAFEEAAERTTENVRGLFYI